MCLPRAVAVRKGFAVDGAAGEGDGAAVAYLGSLAYFVAKIRCIASRLVLEVFRKAVSSSQVMVIVPHSYVTAANEEQRPMQAP